LILSNKQQDKDQISDLLRIIVNAIRLSLGFRTELMTRCGQEDKFHVNIP
jgi:hypothetical protein